MVLALLAIFIEVRRSKWACGADYYYECRNSSKTWTSLRYDVGAEARSIYLTTNSAPVWLAFPPEGG